MSNQAKGFIFGVAVGIVLCKVWTEQQARQG